MFLAAAFLASSGPSSAVAQGADDGKTTAERDWAYPTKGPTREQARTPGPEAPWWQQGPWYAGVEAGIGWFDGDGLTNAPDFVAEGRIACDLADEFYLLGSYTFALAETEVETLAGDSEQEKHDIHVLAFGMGARFLASPEMQLFVEPRVGVLFGSDADVAPAGMLSAGIDLFATEGLAVRFAVTGMVTDSDINTDGEDANLRSGVMGTLGIVFEF